MGIRFVTLIAVALLAQGTPAPAQQVHYDVYEKGIRRGEVVVDGVARTVSVRKRPRSMQDWGAEAVRSWYDAGGSRELRLFGAIVDLAGAIPELDGASWATRTSANWPTASDTYDRQRSIEARVGDSRVEAWYWAQRDVSRPMDLILTTDGTFIAGIDPSGDFVLVRRGYEAFTTVAEWQGAGVSAPRYALAPAKHHMVSTADGPRLSTLVFLPGGDDAEGPWPTILVRTPYGIRSLINAYWHHVVRGYAVVLQAARGTSFTEPQYRSEGDWALINEAGDGATTLRWVAEQPWSDGQVCMQGGSYLGYTQWTATMANDPSLRCIVPEVSMGTVFSDQPYMGGGFVQGLAYYTFFMLDKSLRPGLTWEEVLAHRPLIELDDFATGEDLPLWNTMVSNWRNNEHWGVQDWYRDDGPRDVSSFQISGWFDDDFPGTRANWQLMEERGRGPQRLLIGPWKHGYNVDRSLNGFSFGADAVRPDIWLRKQQWYDRILKGLDNGVEEPRVEYFLLGANEWRSASQWPPAEARAQAWYLHSNGAAGSGLEDGTLSLAAPSTNEPFDEYRYDPRDPPKNWYSFDGMQSWQDVQSFPIEAGDIESRPDVATFTSAVLDEDVTIAGDVLIDLYASTDARDTDWWVHLTDVHPDGRSVRLTLGLLRARFRNLDDPEHRIAGSNFETEELLSGDLEDVVHYRIAIPSIANRFRAGHRIRVAIFNALDNYSFPNSNTGGNEALVTETVVGTMRLHHDVRYPTRVLLPILR